MQADTATEQSVMAVLRRYFEAITARDETALLALFADDPDLLLFGSGMDERRVGKPALLEQTRRDWAQSDAMAFTIGWHAVSAAGAVAWVAAELGVTVTWQGRSLHMPARLTLVLERRAGSWRIVQGHFSFPAGGQAEGESFPRG